MPTPPQGEPAAPRYELAARATMAGELRAATAALVTHNVLRYKAAMIASFRDSDTATVWAGRRSRRRSSDIQRGALRKLRLLNNARRLDDLRVPPRRINEIVRGKRALTADTDLRLARYFRMSEGFFLGLQTDYELMERKRKIGDQLKA